MVNLVEYAVNRINDVAELAVKLLQDLLNTSEVSAIYGDFLEELKRGALDVDEYVKAVEDLENRLQIDAEYMTRALGRFIRGLRGEDAEKIRQILEAATTGDRGDVVHFIASLPALLIRAGCRTGRRDVVMLGIAVEYGLGGYVKEALCGGMAAAALAQGRDDVARKLAEKCIDMDMELTLRRECGVARVIEKYRLDEILTGLSDAVMEMRKMERGE